MKLLKAVHPRETLCKEMHKQMNLAGAPTRLASPELYMILDVDELQKQVNRLENRVSRMDRAAARARWRRKPLQKFLEGKEILVMHCEQGFEKVVPDGFKGKYKTENLETLLNNLRFLADLPEKIIAEAANEDPVLSEQVEDEISLPVEERLIVHKRDFNKIKELAFSEDVSEKNVIDVSKNRTGYAKTSALDEHTEEIKQLLKEGKSRNVIAEKYNVRPQTVNYWIKKRKIITSDQQAPPTPGKKKCPTCIFRQTDKNLGNCAYIEIMGHTRGCSAIECDKYVKGKPLKKRKDSGTKTVNEDA